MASNNKKDCVPHIGVNSLLMEYQLFIESHEMLDQIHQSNNVWPEIENFCSELQQTSALLHLITSLHSQSQIDFERAMFCSWFALIVAKRLKLSAAFQRNLFFAGLFQDAGKHSIEALLPDLMAKANGSHSKKTGGRGKKRDFNEPFHPLVISTFMVESGYLPDRVSELVLNHHAKDDGTGYPHHISENQLDTDHQILIAANEISDYLDLKGGHNNLTHCLPWLRLCSLLYFKRVYTAVVFLLKPHCNYSVDETDIERARIRLINQRESIESLRAKLLCLSAELVRFEDDMPVKGLRSSIRKIMELFSDTGVLNARALDASDAKVISDNIADVNLVYSGLPVLLSHCMSLLQQLESNKRYLDNKALFTDTSHLLKLTVGELEGHRFSVFR